MDSREEEFYTDASLEHLRILKLWRQCPVRFGNGECALRSKGECCEGGCWSQEGVEGVVDDIILLLEL